MTSFNIAKLTYLVFPEINAYLSLLSQLLTK